MKEIVKHVDTFYKLRRKLPLVFLKNIHFALIHSYILHGVEVYGSALNKYLNKLGELHNIVDIASKRQ
jgi:hypothetical protein